MIAKEVAENEFARFVELMDLDLEPDGMDADDAKSLDGFRRVILRSIQRGDLTVTDIGEMVFTPTVGESIPITFGEPTGASLMASDNSRTGKNVAKMFAVMADLTGCSATKFAQMRQRDLKVCQAITSIFLG